MFHIVLVEPEIPPNTGNIARLCAATGTNLHLVGKLGFSTDDRYLKRAGLDYWPWVDLHRHPDLSAFQVERQRRGGRLIALSSRASQSYSTFDFAVDDWLLFGRESDGLPASLQAAADAGLLIPMARSAASSDGSSAGGVRSLNLSVSVAVVLFESLRQLGSLVAP